MRRVVKEESQCFLKVASDVSGAGTYLKNYGLLTSETCLGFSWKRRSNVTLK